MASHHIRDDVSSKQEDRFTVDLIWWDSLRLAPITNQISVSIVYYAVSGMGHIQICVLVNQCLIV